ncbi:hypothetical protein PMAYCL1PPCAC_00525, partial [Pristionchus mayeri]
KWTDYFVDHFAVYLDVLKSPNRDRLDQGCTEALAQANLNLEHEVARLMCVEKMIDKSKSRNLLHCTICAGGSFNYKQCIIHLFDPTHIQEENGLIGTAAIARTSSVVRLIITEDLPSKWKAEEAAFTAEIAMKYASVAIGKSRFRPTNSFEEDSFFRYTDMMKPQLSSFTS